MKKLLNIYIFRRKDGVCLYHYPFGSIQLDPQLISSFLTAILTFIDEMILSGVPTTGGKKVSDMFSRGAYTVMIESGDLVSGALMALSEDSDLRARLKTCIKVFEEYYGEKILTKIIKEDMFKDFDDFVRKTFATRIVEPFRVPKFTASVPKEQLHDYISRVLVDIIDGRKTVFDLSLESKLPLDLVALSILALLEKGVIKLMFKCRKSDILRVTKLGNVVLETREIDVPEHLNSTMALKIISEIDGERTIKEILDKLEIPFETFTKYIEFFYENGYVEYIPPHHFVCRIVMDVMNFLLTASMKYVKKKKIVEIFESTRLFFHEIKNFVNFMEIVNEKVDFETIWRFFISSDMMGAFLIIRLLVFFNYVLMNKIKKIVKPKVWRKIEEEVEEKIRSKYGIEYEHALLMVDLNIKGERVGATRMFLE